jgi:hypothetical protein
MVPRPRGIIAFAASRAVKKPAKAVIPDLAVDAGRRVADVEAHVASDVEDEDLDLADLGLDLAEQVITCSSSRASEPKDGPSRPPR